jgi:excisionase family DNA binding protein
MPDVHSAHPRAQLLAVEGVMAQLSVGRSSVFQLIGRGELKSVKVGRRRLVPQTAVDEYVANLLAARPGDVTAGGDDAA